MEERSITDMKNIGKTVALRLSAIGITSSKQLAQVGAANAYKKLSRKHPDKHLPVCYYLYSLEGALQNKHWADLSKQEKTNLRLSAGLSK